MRKISAIFILIIFVTPYVRGQEIPPRTKQEQSQGSFSSDSLKQYKSDGIRMKALTDYHFYKEIRNPQMEKITGSFSLQRKKKTFSILNTPYSKFILPAAMVSYGLIAQGSEELKGLDKSTTHEIKEHYDGTFPIDDYLQYAPYAAYYSLDVCGIKAKHNFRDRTIILAVSYAIMGGTVQGMKLGFGKVRPDGSSKTSFPSGRTATAFLGAHLLFKEYKEVSPWIGVAGYLSATSVGCLRVSNKKHWVSDVVTGAGIGILSAEIGYMLLPVFQTLFGVNSNEKSLVIAPAISTEGCEIGLAYTF